ncbi:hypothetical protein J4456_05070 [Candidatus Pacearchaeota archaeon]|nr:hypothetical protein [Candidatus Pacearchaeota archaeon]
MKRGLLLAIIFGIFIGSIFAAGGGGSGGGNNGGGGGDSGESSSGSSSGGDSGEPQFTKVTCDDTGRIKFSMSKQESITSVNTLTNETLEITGYWKFGEFESDPIFVVAGSYSITSSYGLTRTFTCPGLHDCFHISVEDLHCKSRNLKNEITFELVGDSNLDHYALNFKTDKKILKYSKEIQSRELEEIIINQNDNKIRIFVNNVSMSDVEIVHNDCVGKNYVYARAKCTFTGVTSAIEPDRLKCGGLLDIHDRVKCRIQLESEHHEYEKFFPEECRNHKDGKKCVQIYRNVSDCWDLEPSARRILCLKEKIRLVNRNDEKEKCDGEEKCVKDLNERLMTMIKLRFYNLEEQAEILNEKGLLSEKYLIDFVVSIEGKKLAFNDANTKKEMETVIAEVKELWSVLMEKVNNE